MSDNTTPEIDFEITDGGVIIRIGDDQGLDFTTPYEDPDKIQASIAHTKALLEKLGAALPGILLGLEDLALEVGQKCETCGGDEEIPTKGRTTTKCPDCNGNGRRYPAVAAA
jgi:hypothetical protein